MEYQRIMNLLDNMPNQPSKFKITNWFQINDEPQEKYHVQINLKLQYQGQVSRIIAIHIRGYIYTC